MTDTVRARVYYKKKSFIYSAADENGIGTFTTGDASIATVDAAGNITGVKKGQTYVRFTAYNGRSAQANVTVLGVPTELHLDKSELKLGVGDAGKLTPSFGPYEMGTVTYTSENANVVTVDANGTLKAIDKGETTIKATCNGLEATCKVTVVAAPAKIEINGTINIIKGRTMEIPATVLNTDGEVCETTLTLVTGNRKIVAVSGTRIGGVKAGTATVRVETYNGVKAYVKVTVWEKPTSVVLDKKSVSIGEGMTDTVRARVYYKKKSFVYSAADENGIGTFTTGDASIATVDAAGNITGVKKGQTYVRFTAYNGRSAQANVTVLGVPTELHLDKSELKLGVGDAGKLTPSFGPYEMGTVTYTSENANVVTVDANGTLKAIDKGETTIKATCNGLEATCKVTVVAAPAKIEINGTINIIKGRTMEIPATVLNTDGEVCETTLTLVTGNRKIVAVSGTRIGGVKAGTATVRVETYNGVKAYVKVTVWEKPTSVVLDQKSLTIGEDTTAQVRARVYYKKKSFIYSAADANGIGAFTTGDASIATVDAAGNVTGVRKGQTYLRFTTYNGRVVQIPVYVKSAPTELHLDRSELALGVAMTAKLTASFGADEIGAAKFETSDGAVATVDANGTVTAKAAGAAIITASVTSKSGETLSQACSVRVYPAPDKITLNMTSSNVALKGTVALRASCTYQGSEDCMASLRFASSNSKVATVDANGNIRGVKAGSATIRVTAQNGVYADCYVVVRKAPTKVALSTGSRTLGVGQTFLLQGRIYYSGGSFIFSGNDSSMATFESSNSSVVKVDAYGNVTALQEGTANLRLRTYNGKGSNVYCRVTVTAGPDWLAFTQTEVGLSVGQQLTLTCNQTPGSVTSYSYSSSNTALATVSGSDNNCTVTAVAEGEVTITVTSSNGRTATCNVHVYAEPSGVAFEQSEVSIAIGETGKLPAVKVSTNGKECSQNVTYVSSDASVVTVTDEGYIKGEKAGQATVTAMTYNGKKASCTVKVLPEPTKMSVTADAAQLAVGDTTTLRVTMDSVGAYTFASSDSSVLTVDAKGTATALKAGTATVTVTAYNGLKGQCTIAVLNAPSDVRLSEDALTLGVGMTAQLTVSIPKDTLGKYAFTSSDEAVATVDAEGRVTAKAAGKAQIAVGVQGHDAVFDTCEVTVLSMPKSVELSASALELKTGATAKLAATLVNGSDRSCYGEIRYASSDAAVVSVADDGTLTALKAGSATITVSASADSSVAAECRVTVADAKIRLSESSLTLGVGETATVEMIRTGSDGVTLSGTNDDVATMDTDGKVVAKAKGTTTITVRCGDESASCEITVLDKPGSVTIAASRKKLAVGRSFALNAALPEGTASKLTYTSSNDRVATVDNRGRVTAVGNGTATITVSTYDASVSASCVITAVYEPDMIRFAELDSLILATGDAYVLETPVMYSAQGDCDAAYTLSISNSKVASVSVQNGRYVITAKAEGEATLRLKTSNGKTATCALTVAAKPASISFETDELKMGLGETFSPVITGNNGARLSCTLTSSNSEVVRVDDGVLTAAAKGSATLTATYGELTAKMEIEVVEPARTLRLSAASLRMGVGETLKLTASAEEGEGAASVTFLSGDETVAQVDRSGRIRAVGKGKTVVTAVCGTAQATCIVEVSAMATSLKIHPANLVASVGESIALKLSFGSADEYANVLFESSDESIATVRQDGLVTFHKAGTVKISAETCNGVDDEITVTVGEKPGSVAFAAQTASILKGDAALLPVVFDKGGCYYQLTSSNPDVLSVDEDGRIVANKAGTAEITLTAPSDDKLTAKCTVTVIEKLSGITATAQKETLEIGETTELTYTLLPADLVGTANVRFESTDESVATVDAETGVVTGVAYGTAQIRLIASDGTVGTCTVKVLGGKRRALVAYYYGETGDPGYLPFAMNNGYSMVEALKAATVEGQRYAVTGALSNPSKASLFSSIDSTFADATDDDVSVIYLCAHGSAGYGSQYYFTMPAGEGKNSDAYRVYANELMDHILKIKGRVFVIMDSCNSGGLIDCTYGRLEAEGGRIAVVTSSHRSTPSSFYSVTNKRQSVDFFTFAVLDGLGYNECEGLNGRGHGFYSTSAPADTNRDGAVTVQELANYAVPKTVSLVKSMASSKYFLGNKDQTPQSYIGELCKDLTIFGR